MIRSSHENAVFSWTYKTYKSIIAVETDEILMETQCSFFLTTKQRF